MKMTAAQKSLLEEIGSGPYQVEGRRIRAINVLVEQGLITAKWTPIRYQNGRVVITYICKAVAA